MDSHPSKLTVIGALRKSSHYAVLLIIGKSHDMSHRRTSEKQKIQNTGE